MTTQLMQSIDRYRALDGLLIMAATNSLDGLEPTLIREGRFDVKLRLDLPNQAEREAMLASLIKTGRHTAPGDDHSAEFYVYGRKRGQFWLLELADGVFGGYGVCQMREKIREFGLLRFAENPAEITAMH